MMSHEAPAIPRPSIPQIGKNYLITTDNWFIAPVVGAKLQLY